METKTLLDHLDDAYKEITKKGDKNKKIQDFISDDNKCAEIIRAILHDDEFVVPDEKNRLYEFSTARSRHALITFLIGILFSGFEDLKIDIANMFQSFFKEDDVSRTSTDSVFTHLWMLTALYHDYAYYSRYIMQEDLDYKKTFKRYLLQDKYNEKRLVGLNKFEHLVGACKTMAFTYTEIEAYDRYARKFHKKDKVEKVDHGILGGVLIFDRLVRKIGLKEGVLQIKELIEVKTSCVTIAQHNIYKSQDDKTDKEYGDELRKLYHDSDYHIEKSTPLLLLLCLVDTFECIKRFGKGNIQKGSLQTLTVLRNISVGVDKNYVRIDYTKLKQYIHDKKLMPAENIYIHYMESLSSLHSWTGLQSNIDDDVVVISYKPEVFVTKEQGVNRNTM